MGLFSKKNKAPKAPPPSSLAGRRTSYVQPPQPSDPSLPGLAGWCGSEKNKALPHRFNYVRPDGKPEDPRRLWSDPDDPY